MMLSTQPRILDNEFDYLQSNMQGNSAPYLAFNSEVKQIVGKKPLFYEMTPSELYGQELHPTTLRQTQNFFNATSPLLCSPSLIYRDPELKATFGTTADGKSYFFAASYHGSLSPELCRHLTKAFPAAIKESMARQLQAPKSGADFMDCIRDIFVSQQQLRYKFINECYTDIMVQILFQRQTSYELIQALASRALEPRAVKEGCLAKCHDHPVKGAPTMRYFARFFNAQGSDQVIAASKNAGVGRYIEWKGICIFIAETTGPRARSKTSPAPRPMPMPVPVPVPGAIAAVYVNDGDIFMLESELKLRSFERARQQQEKYSKYFKLLPSIAEGVEEPARSKEEKNKEEVQVGEEEEEEKERPRWSITRRWMVGLAVGAGSAAALINALSRK